MRARKGNWGRAIIEHLEHVNDLVAADAQYHSSCMKKQSAAAIVTEDTLSRVYETKHYPPSDNFFEEVESDILESLRVFLDDVILKNKRSSLKKWKKKSIALAHSIIAAARPKYFVSSLQDGIVAFLF